jgi:formyl-CoA transferase
VPDLTNIAHPVNFHGSPASYHRPPPLLGEHSEEVLREFGFSNTETRELMGAKVVLPAARKGE